MQPANVSLLVVLLVTLVCVAVFIIATLSSHDAGDDMSANNPDNFYTSAPIDTADDFKPDDMPIHIESIIDEDEAKGDDMGNIQNSFNFVLGTMAACHMANQHLKNQEEANYDEGTEVEDVDADEEYVRNTSKTAADSHSNDVPKDAVFAKISEVAELVMRINRLMSRISDPGAVMKTDIVGDADIGILIDEIDAIMYGETPNVSDISERSVKYWRCMFLNELCEFNDLTDSDQLDEYDFSFSSLTRHKLAIIAKAWSLSVCTYQMLLSCVK